jgi:regulator of protease activity HflC (stomatin/prohibitin superfamily)
MVKASVAVQYKARRVNQYLYNYEHPEEVLEAIVYQALTDYSARVNIDRVIGPGRKAFESGLRDFVQRRIDELETPLGIDVVFVGLQGCHPPFEEGVAAAFQNVVAAEIKKEASIEAARGKAQQVKSQVAGSVERADLLDARIVEIDELEAGGQATQEELAAAQQRVDELLMGDEAAGVSPMSGEAAAEIARAEANRTIGLSVARSRQTLFANELQAHEAAPRLYEMRKYLEMLTEVARAIRKIVVLGDADETDLIIILDPEKQTILDLGEPEAGK